MQKETTKSREPASSETGLVAMFDENNRLHGDRAKE
jgi:hypothetical protein